VVYHGQSRWSVASNLAALFNIPPALSRFIPDYEYWLCDVSRYSDEEIKGEVILRVGLLLLKYIWQENLGQRLGSILSLLLELFEQETGLEYLQTILRYVSGSTDRISEDELKQVVTELFREGETIMPTLAEQWMERGRLQGLEQGRREAALNLLRRFLHHRFGIPLDHFDNEFQILNLTAIDRLSDSAFEVESLTEFEAVLTELITILNVANSSS
jgi:hypothetical protein